MRLKRLELFGFKSFADRTSLEFPHSLTGIVGPNGCGKSNVVDSVRWVLGEQRPTSMRGGEMSDVIFKGSTSRPAMGVAEVSLVLDNANNELEGRPTEVSITRRVFKSGEGEYLINGERVRLKDVRDMLFDTGLGSRGYAVLEQGKIDAVLSQNALDRRAIFEEAAGISRFRVRKREAETRLKRVEADMLRLDDVLRELSTRVRSLKIQAGKAERYVGARDEWRRERALALRQRWKWSSAALAELGERLAENEAKSRELREARETGEAELVLRTAEQQALAGELERVSGEISRLSGESRAQGERESALNSRIAAWKASAQEEHHRSRAQEKQRALRRQELAKLEASLAELAQKAAAAEKQSSEHAAALSAVRAEYRSVRERTEAQNEVVLRALHEKTAASNSARLLENSRGPLAARRERAQQRLSEHESQVADLRRAAESAAERVESMRLSLADSEGERARLRDEFSQLESSTRELESRKKALELERARASSRVAVLRDVERERQGLEAGAKALLESLRSGKGPLGADEVGGLFADHVRTSTRLARALDAALGERALGLVARSKPAALRSVEWLKQGQRGEVRVLFQDANVAGTGSREGLEAFDEAERGRLIARLRDEVVCESGFEGLADYLVGDVFVATDLQACLDLASAHPKWRFATREGDLVDAAGLVGGHRELAQGAVGRRSSAEELERSAAELSARIAQLEVEESQARARREQLLEMRAGSEKVFEERRQAMSGAEREHHTTRARLVDLDSSLSLARRECDNVGAELTRLDDDLATAKQRVLRGEAEFGELNQELGRLDLLRREVEAARDAALRVEQELSVEHTRLRAEHEGQARRQSDLARHLDELGLELERSQRLAAENDRCAEEAAAEIAKLKQDSDAVLVERAGLEERLGGLRTNERAARDSIDAFRRRLDAATRELELVHARVGDLRLEQQRLELERAEALARAMEDLGLDESSLAAGAAAGELDMDAAALTALDQRVATLKQELDRIGPVNTEAVAELTEAEGRFDFLDGQRKDLDRAKRSLTESLATINDESVRLFLATFEEVRAHFQGLFRQLFGGGKADLELQQGVDPLEGGIEISARPPGREMLPIGLLSGGQRTMTALALLFAVFKARPSPFCVLDEVDAALDDANIGRFLGMLDSFRQGTQFIIVTHNKGSMAACDGLYGITMEVKGVSRYVAVEFGDVERFDPEATGNATAASRSREEVQSRRSPADEPRHVEDGADLGRDANDGDEPTVTLRPAPRGQAEGEPQQRSGAGELLATAGEQ